MRRAGIDIYHLSLDRTGRYDESLGSTLAGEIDQDLSNPDLQLFLDNRLRVLEETEKDGERLAQIIKFRTGYNPQGKEHSLKEIGRIFKISGERVRQLEVRAYKKMRDILEGN